MWDSVSIRKIVGVRLPRRDVNALWDVYIKDGKTGSVEPHQTASSAPQNDPSVVTAHGCFLAPSLCHAHIHLDKCFLLQDPKFADLEIVKGDFAEAMNLTSQAKRRFAEDDLLHRGRRLIEESIQAGVTHMRAFVELDADVEARCLAAGLKLKDEFRERCEVQLCAFAQLPCFSGADDGKTVRRLLEEAASHPAVDVMGSTPYVESDRAKMRENVRWVSELALMNSKHLDFHMDYNLDPQQEPLVYDAVDTLRTLRWRKENPEKTVAMGHCTRLTQFDQAEWKALKEAIGDLPVSFIGLPTSDLFMMRAASGVRGTLNVRNMIRDYDFNAAVAINNVGNAFTPQGSCDPMSIASLCVGVYQAGTKRDTELLYVGSFMATS
jgi:cytosine/adenosine deaminase-related metal-dependent hydrolase